MLAAARLAARGASALPRAGWATRRAALSSSVSGGPPGMKEEDIKKKIQPIIPKRLPDLLKLDLVEDKASEEIGAIWDAYHATKRDCVSATLPGAEWDKLQQRSTKCPMFVYPVKKDGGAYYTLISQWNEAHCVLTYLEDYTRNPTGAVPYFYLVAYPDLVESKDLVLVRAEFLPYLTKPEAQTLLDQVLDFYVRDDAKHASVETFNLAPHAFDFNAVFDIPANP